MGLTEEVTAVVLNARPERGDKVRTGHRLRCAVLSCDAMCCDTMCCAVIRCDAMCCDVMSCDAMCCVVLCSITSHKLTKSFQIDKN